MSSGLCALDRKRGGNLVKAIQYGTPDPWNINLPASALVLLSPEQDGCQPSSFSTSLHLVLLSQSSLILVCQFGVVMVQVLHWALPGAYQQVHVQAGLFTPPRHSLQEV